jgi:tetrahydromethanopterin S-methyltransferase subunit G
MTAPTKELASTPNGSLRSLLGMVADHFERAEAQATARFDGMDRRFDRLEAEMNRRFDAVDQRLDAVDQRFEAVDRRFDAVDRRFDRLDASIEKLTGVIIRKELKVTDSMM